MKDRKQEMKERNEERKKRERKYDKQGVKRKKDKPTEQALDLVDRPFRGPVFLAALGGGQVEGLGLAL